jgi:hypothetical protein
MTTLKAWIALIFLIVTAITSSDIVPVAGTAHVIWTIVSVIVGAIATWAAPNKQILSRPTVIDGKVK